MVTAGVFILLRMGPIISQSEKVMSAVAIVGAVTAFFAATLGLVQNDIKKVIAYSTCSQLGYMVLASGIGASSASIFHLFNHAFFKALLFLSAGSVIHAIADEQDLRKMGGLITRQRYTYTMILVGSMALMGFPFLTGYYSKDAIIELAYATYTVTGTFGHYLLTVSAMLTAFYSMRVINLAFMQDPQGSKDVYEGAHEPGIKMSLPLVILGIASIYIGYVMKDIVMGPGAPYIDFVGPSAHHSIESEFIPTWIKWIPVVLSLIGASYGMYVYPMSGKRINKKLYTFLSNKWHIDQLYNTVIVEKVLRWGYTITYKILDRGLIEKIGPTGIIETVTSLAVTSSKIHSGQIYHYSLAMIIGTVVMILINSLM